MNPADVAQSTLPLASSDVSLIALFWQAHWVVKCVMLGLLSCSVWVWAIAIDKILLYARTKRAMDKFEQALQQEWASASPAQQQVLQAWREHAQLLRSRYWRAP